MSAAGDLRHARVIPLQGVRLRFLRMTSTTGDEGRGAPLDCDDDYLVTLQLAPQREQQLWREGTEIPQPPHAGGALYIMDMTHRWQRRHGGPYDNLLIRVGFSGLRELARSLGFDRVTGLKPVTGVIDPVMEALGKAWTSALETGDGQNATLMQQLARAMFAHLVGAYGSAEVPPGGRRLLSEAQEQVAKAYMRDHAGRNVSVDDIACAVGLSRGYFSKAFTRTVGVTPFRWLMSHRIQRAKDMLAEGEPIARIAADCGFSDQSHLNRVFARETGISPALWRKHADGTS